MRQLRPSYRDGFDHDEGDPLGELVLLLSLVIILTGDTLDKLLVLVLLTIMVGRRGR